jgi:hypothetical protein
MSAEKEAKKLQSKKKDRIFSTPVKLQSKPFFGPISILKFAFKVAKKA